MNLSNLSFRVNHEYFKNTFFLSAVLEWNKLDSFIKNSGIFMLFKKCLPEFIRPKPNSIFNIHNSVGKKYLPRLKLGFRHLKEHKFKHNFQDVVDPLCSCGIETESMKQFLLHCADFSIQRETLFDKLTELNIDVLTRNDDDYIVKTLLLGQQDFDNDFDFIIATERLDCYLFSFFFFSFL